MIRTIVSLYLYTNLLTLYVVSYQIGSIAKTEDHGTNASMSETV